MDEKVLTRKNGKGHAMQIILIAIYLVCTVSGLLLLKMNSGGSSLGLEGGALSARFPLGFILGLFFYAVSFVLWIVILRGGSLNFIYPVVTGMVYISVMAGSYLVLKEPITVKQLAGTAVILVGVVLMNLK